MCNEIVPTSVFWWLTLMGGYSSASDFDVDTLALLAAHHASSEE